MSESQIAQQTSEWYDKYHAWLLKHDYVKLDGYYFDKQRDNEIVLNGQDPAGPIWIVEERGYTDDVKRGKK